jgi:hypothetical protein
VLGWVAGGNTRFLDDDKLEDEHQVSIIPSIGRVLVFEHPILHEGQLVEGGIKYAVRSDIMYRPLTPQAQKTANEVAVRIHGSSKASVKAVKS